MSTESDLTVGGLDDVAMVNGVAPQQGPLPGEELEQLYDVPVMVSAILGHASIPVADLLKIGPGSLLELDRKVGEAIDIRVNDRIVARGEVVLVDDRLGVTMTEIVTPPA